MKDLLFVVLHFHFTVIYLRKDDICIRCPNYCHPSMEDDQCENDTTAEHCDELCGTTEELCDDRYDVTEKL